MSGCIWIDVYGNLLLFSLKNIMCSKLGEKFHLYGVEITSYNPCLTFNRQQIETKL